MRTKNAFCPAMIIIEPGTIVCDSVTEESGMITHASIDGAQQLLYLFQPARLNPDTGAPVRGVWLTPNRAVHSGPGCLIKARFPLELLGTVVKDEATGFTGTVTALTQHLSGCIHADVQPKGVLKNGDMIQALDFDVRRLIGPPRMTKAQREQSERDHPSPAPCPPRPRA